MHPEEFVQSQRPHVVRAEGGYWAGVLTEVGDRARNKLFLATKVLRAIEGLPDGRQHDANPLSPGRMVAT